MQTNLESKDIEQLLAQADELIQQVDADILSDVEETHRLKIEMRTRKLAEVKTEVQRKIEQDGLYKISHSNEGVHEAFQEITKAMGQLKKYLAGHRPDKGN